MALTPTAAEFDDLELALGGALTEITLRMPPAAVPPGALNAAEIELTDDEGTPIAAFRPLPTDPTTDPTVDLAADPTPVAGLRRGTVRPLRPHESGRFAALRRPAREVAPTVRAGTIGVATSAPLTPGQVAAVRSLAAAGTPVLLLGLVGTGRARPLPPEALLRTLTEAAGPGVTVVAVPLRARPDLDPAGDAALVRAVAAAYGIVDLRAPAALVPPVPDLPDGPETPPVPGPPDLPDLPILERELARTAPGNGGRGAVVLFTGLSGSGKSTLARAVADAVAEDGARTVTLLDGDVVRRNLSAGLGFSRADRNRNVARIGFVAALVAEHGGIALAAPIAPYAATRAEVRAAAEAVGDFVLVHVSTPLAVCEARDRKGLYARARRGEIPEFTGISDPYEVPTDADLVVDTSAVDIRAGADAVLERLRALGHLAPLVGCGVVGAGRGGPPAA